MDADAVLQAAKETGAMVTVEDASILGGLGGAISELLVEHCPVAMRRVGVRDQFGESGTSAELQAHYGLTAASICTAVIRRGGAVPVESAIRSVIARAERSRAKLISTRSRGRVRM